MLRTHLSCKMSTEANARCLTGHTCAALVACNTMEIHSPKFAAMAKNVKSVDKFCDDCHFSYILATRF